MLIAGRLLRHESRATEYKGRPRGPRNIFTRASDQNDPEENDQAGQLAKHKRCGCPLCLQIVAQAEADQQIQVTLTD